jgi:hypothetical protein
LAELLGRPAAADAAKRLAAANAVRLALKPHGLIPSIKAILARTQRDPQWLESRPPLLPLADNQRAALYADPAIAALLASAHAEA